MITPSKGKPDPVDVHVGERLRLARALRRMSQETLGKLNGITFQQVQKYENAANRLSISRLVHFARCLNVPVGWFLEKLPFDNEQSDSSGTPLIDMSLPHQREVQELLRVYFAIDDHTMRCYLRQMMALMGTVRN